jgi:hypothetical protein
VFSSLHSILPLDSAARVIQTALTPIFLLAGIATLLNVFSTRLARVVDRAGAVIKAIETADPETIKNLERELSRLLSYSTRRSSWARPAEGSPAQRL